MLFALILLISLLALIATYFNQILILCILALLPLIAICLITWMDIEIHPTKKDQINPTSAINHLWGAFSISVVGIILICLGFSKWWLFLFIPVIYIIHKFLINFLIKISICNIRDKFFR